MTSTTIDGRVPIGPDPGSAGPSSLAAPPRPRITWIARRFAVSALAMLLAAPPVAGQDARAVDQAIANQNITLRRFKPQRPAGSVETTIVVDQRSRTPPERAAAIRFTLRSVTVESNDAVPDSDLATIWAARIGTSVSLAEVYDFAQAIEAAYLERDYFATAFVPVQDVAAGAIVIRVNEAYISEIEIASSVPGIERRLAAYVDPIVAMRPVRVSTAERVLSLLADVGGMQIEGTLDSPEPTGGATLRLDADIVRRRGGVSLDNYGNAQVGPLQLSASVAFNNLFHQFETTSLLAVTVPDSPREMKLMQGTQDFPLGVGGLWLGYNLTSLDSQPGGRADADIDVSTKIASVYLYYPFVRNFGQRLAGWVEINARNDDVDIAGQPAVRDRARWIQAALQYDRVIGDGTVTAVAALAQGLGGLGANTGRADFSRPDVPGDYRFGRLDLDYRRPLGEQASLRLRATGQYAVDPLPGALQFSVGGDPYGWAFTGHGIAGDKGAAASLELAHDVSDQLNWPPGWQVRGFADYGGVWNNDPGGDAIGHDAFGSVGIGLAGGIGAAAATLTVATPWLTPDHAEDPGTGVFFSLAWGF